MLQIEELSQLAAANGHGIDPTITLTFAGAVVLGVVFTLLSQKMRIPPVVVLLVGGILIGPECLGLVDPKALHGGLTAIIALSVGVILFEGGLSLHPHGYKSAGREIRGILTIGLVISLLGTAGLIKLFHPEFGFKFCMLCAATILITGPSVIGQILRRIRVPKKIHHILHWEGVLVDPIGVFIALLCYEFVLMYGSEDLLVALEGFGLRILIGLIAGLVGGFMLVQGIRRRWIPEEMMNIIVLASAIGIFGICERFAHESGLLGVTVAGFFVAAMDVPEIRKLRAYKAELIELLIGLLFVLLSANLEFEKFLKLGTDGLWVVLLTLFLVRPAMIFASTLRSDLNLREKLFLSWVGPRGIIAASMASLFAINLSKSDPEAAFFLESFTYAMIIATVAVQGFLTKYIGQVLNVVEREPNGWLIIGAHRLAREVAAFIRDCGFHVVVVDHNPRLVSLARRANLSAVCANPLTVDEETTPDLYGIGNVLAVSEYGDLNSRVCVRFRNESPELNLYRWAPGGDMEEVLDADLVAGETVWEPLQYSTLRTIEVEGARNLERLTDDIASFRHPERILACLQGERLTPVVPGGLTGACTVLAYQPFAVTLDLNIQQDWIRYSAADTMSGLFSELLNCLRQKFPHLDADVVRNNLIRQENEYSSLVGYNVALPHFHLKDIDESVVLIAKLKSPLIDQHSGDLIRFVFLVLSPSSQPRAHLNSLSEISRFIMEEQNRERLDLATNQAEMQQIFFPH